MEEIEIGSVVYLKCNPEIKMIVFNTYNNGRIFCHWLDSTGQLQEEEFNINELKVK